MLDYIMRIFGLAALAFMVYFLIEEQVNKHNK
jgi:hypothetical protein